MNDDKDFEIVLRIKDGVLNIRHPDGVENLINSVYYLALAHQIILQKSVLPTADKPGGKIVPVHSLPKMTH